MKNNTSWMNEETCTACCPGPQEGGGTLREYFHILGNTGEAFQKATIQSWVYLYVLLWIFMLWIGISLQRSFVNGPMIGDLKKKKKCYLMANSQQIQESCPSLPVDLKELNSWLISYHFYSVHSSRTLPNQDYKQKTSNKQHTSCLFVSKYTVHISER